MKRSYMLPLLALLGVAIAVVVIVNDSRPISTQTPAVQLPKPPYSSYVTGSGIVETALGNTVIGTPVPGIVTEIDVKVGDHVEAGEVLFKIDDRDLQAQLLTMEAKLKEAEAAVLLPKHRLEYTEHLAQRDAAAVGQQTLSDLRDETSRASASLEVAKAGLAQLRLDIERRTVRAPVEGRILQMRIRLGEYVDNTHTAEPLMLFGSIDRLYVRTDIDENEEWRLQPGSAATAFVRGNPALKIALRFEYIEPYVTAKIALTGQVTERSDRRVLQVIYSFDHGDLPIYVGQQVDVYIPTQPLTQ